MQEILIWVMACIGTYFLGSIPIGYIVCKVLKNIDIRKIGSGNIGTTNVVRLLGLKGAIIVFPLDFLKGFVPALLAYKYGGELMGLVIGLCAILGHDFSLWLKFKGGKGVSTSAGVLFALMPWAGLVAVVTWLCGLAVTRIVSLSTCIAAVGISIYGIFADLSPAYKIVIYAIAVVVFVLHRKNLQRVASGTEPKVGKKEV